MKLIIFDLDQTLVDFISVHDEVTQRLFRRFFNVDARLTDIDFAGKSLTENFAKLARLKNIPEDVFHKEREQLQESYESTFGESMPDKAADYVLPGARELLSELSQTDNVLALYTGDSRIIVNQVFRATGLFHRTYNLLSRCEEAAFARTGISPQQVWVLTAIKYAKSPVTIRKVARFMDRDVNTITMTVNRMEKASLVKRVRDLRDRRSVRLEATRRGQDVFGQAEKISLELINRVLSDFSDRDLEQAAKLMDKMRKSSQRELNHRKKPTA